MDSSVPSLEKGDFNNHTAAGRFRGTCGFSFLLRGTVKPFRPESLHPVSEYK
jgi:hypothetical protein